MSDDKLRAEIARMRHYRRQTGYDEDCDPRQLTPGQCKCVLISADLAPRLADALEAAEREVGRLRAILLDLVIADDAITVATAALMTAPKSEDFGRMFDRATDDQKAAVKTARAALEGRDDE